MKSLSSENKGALLAVTSGLLYGFVGYFGVTLMNDLSIANSQFWRFIISAIFMLIFFAKQFIKSKENLFAMICTFCFGGLFYSTAAGTYFMSSTYIGTGLSMVIFFTYPALVMLLNLIFYKTKIAKIYYLAIILIAFGMTFLIDINELSVDFSGIGLAVLSALLYAFYIVSSDKLQISPIASTIMVSLGCAFSCLCYALWDHSFIIPSTSHQWIAIIGFGILTTALPVYMFLESLKKISAEKASILSVTEPIFVVIFGVVLLGEAIDVPKIFGIIAILTGALITLVNKKAKPTYSVEGA